MTIIDYNIIGIHVFGFNGLPSGEGIIVAQALGSEETITLRLGGPGLDVTGAEIDWLEFERRVTKLMSAYCRRFSVGLSFVQIPGDSFPVITFVG
jgi:hypothetical protein